MTWEQDPGDKLIYRQSITGDTVSSGAWTISPGDPASLLDNKSDTTTYTQIRVKGLTVGTIYNLTVHVIGASGQEWDRTTLIRCAERYA